MGNDGRAIEWRQKLTHIVTNLIKELGDKDGVNWGQVEREGQRLIVLSKEASHIHIRGRYSHIIEKMNG